MKFLYVLECPTLVHMKIESDETQSTIEVLDQEKICHRCGLPFNRFVRYELEEGD
jgi:hypothetical protein